MKIALFGNTYKVEAIDTAISLLQLLKKHDAEVYIESSFYRFLQDHKVENLISGVIEDDNFMADLALSFGGDGTFLNTAKHVNTKEIPILGINTGRLGFLADVADTEIEHVLQDVLNNRFSIEERTVLQLIAENSILHEYPYALNEIALLKQDSSSMITIHVKVNGEFLNAYRADGLIIATPTGSTAYSMSVGGPIVVPQTNNLILSPVASHSLNIRPLIIPDNWELEINVISRTKSFLVSLDGRSDILDQHTYLKVKKAGHKVKLVKPIGHNFFCTLKNKLMWGADKRTE
jgi:NAD+ kinase